MTEWWRNRYHKRLCNMERRGKCSQGGDWHICRKAANHKGPHECRGTDLDW